MTDPNTVWVVRAGAHGEREQDCLDTGVISIGWENLPDLSDHLSANSDSRTNLTDLVRGEVPEAPRRACNNYVWHLWKFVFRLKLGDLIVMPCKTRSEVMIGELTGDYNYVPIPGSLICHQRSVNWLRGVQRIDMKTDLRYSMNASISLYIPSASNAHERIRALADTGKDPGATMISASTKTEPDESLEIDLEQSARDAICSRIAQEYTGHRLQNLTAQLLEVEGYSTTVARPGPDGGVDIVPGRGLLGLNHPRIVVQVKSGDGRVDVNVIRSLQGVIGRSGADQGLLVAWGEVTHAAQKELDAQPFLIRVWDKDDLTRVLLDNYHKLDETLRAEIPLKRVWMLAG